MLLIALHGEQGAGKDATAEILVRKHGFTRFAFADRLKQMCEALNPVVTYEVDPRLVAEMTRYTASQCDEWPTLRVVRLKDVVDRVGWDQAKRDYPEVRRTQQYLATEVVRDYVSENFWVDEVERGLRGCQRAVITDLRFPSEYDMVQRLGGVVWWVLRPNNPHRQAHAAHRSEAWHPPVYREVVNDGGDLDQLADTVRESLLSWYGQGVAPIEEVTITPQDVVDAIERASRATG